jgi:endonuclease III
MTNEQLYLAIGIPIVFNTIVSVLIYTLLSARITDLGPRFDAINQRFDDMRDLWRAELNRVEEVIDARLKYLEEHLS